MQDFIENADPRSVAGVFGRIHDEQGDIDVLINNAAVITVPDFQDFVRNVDDARVMESFAVTLPDGVDLSLMISVLGAAILSLGLVQLLAARWSWEKTWLWD